MQVDYLLPIILTTICAKWAGDHLNHGIYHTVLAMKRIPFLESPPPPAEYGGPLSTLKASDLIASGNVDTLPLHAPVQLVVERLQALPLRNGFPVVQERLVPGGRRGTGPYLSSFCGLVLRHEIIAVLDRKRFYARRRTTSAGGGGVSEAGHDDDDVVMERITSPSRTSAGVVQGTGLQLGLRDSIADQSAFYEAEADDEAATPLTPQTRGDVAAIGAFQARSDDQRMLEESVLKLTAVERELYMDIGESMNPAPYSVQLETPAECVHRLFRAVGLRHVVVLDGFGQVAGIVTRQDILQAMTRVQHGSDHH